MAFSMSNAMQTTSTTIEHTPAYISANEKASPVHPGEAFVVSMVLEFHSS